MCLFACLAVLGLSCYTQGSELKRANAWWEFVEPSSLTRDRTCVPCTGGVESEPLEPPGKSQ